MVYTVMANLKVECDVDVNATTLEDALEKARKLREVDFIEFKGQFMDGELHIKGIFENN